VSQEARVLRVEVLVFALALLTYGYCFDREVGTNALAHYDQSVSIAVLGELSIDRVLALKEGEDLYAYTMDWSRVNGRYYPAKAPGLSLAGAPLELALATTCRMVGKDPLERRAFERNGQILAWLLVALPAAFAAVALTRLARELGASLENAVLGTLAITLGTIWAPFASVLYAHVPTGVALVFAARFVLGSELTRRRAAAAGALAGVAVLLTYPAALVIPALAAIVWVRTRDARAVGAFAAGGLPALAVHAAYHTAAFGSPFRTAYDFQNALYGGTGGRSYLTTLLEPREAVGRIAELTFLPYRGIFFYSPFVLFALGAAIWALKDERSHRILSPRLACGSPGFASRKQLAAGLALATFAGFFAVNALHHGWWGGFTTGPRYLVPGLPLLAPFAAEAFARFRAASVVLAAISLANALATLAVSVSVHERVPIPLLDVYRGLFQGLLGRGNVGEFLGLAGDLSLVPYVLVAGGLSVALARLLLRPGDRVESGTPGIC
jgi:hypothetical protein